MKLPWQIEMHDSFIKKLAAVLMLFALTVLSGCSYDVPEGYKKQLHSYEEAVAYAKSLDPDATVSSECEETELQTVKFRIWPAVIGGRKCSVCSMGANVYNKGWAAGEFPVRYYRLDTDYDYYVIREVLKSHPDLEPDDETEEVSLWKRFEANDLISVKLKKDSLTKESFSALWDEYLQVNKEISSYPVHKRFGLSVYMPDNYFKFETGTDEELEKAREKMIKAGYLEE